MSLQASIVVPTYERPALLERCLHALLAQDLPAKDFEIIVVHDGASPGTRHLLSKLVESVPSVLATQIRYLEQPHRGPAAARNTGWRHAVGAVVAFTDDDTIAEPSWLRHGFAAFAAGADAAWGAIEVPLSGSPTDYELDAAGLARAPFVTANCFVRRTLLEAVGGFDERFALAWREDSDLYFRLIEHGARIDHVPGARLVHPVRPGCWGVSLKQQRKVLYDALLFKKHRRLYRRFIRPTPRWDYYAIVLALTGTLLTAGTQNAAFALALGGVWGLLTIRLCLLRLLPTSKKWPHLAEMVVTSALIPPLAVFWRAVGAARFKVAFL